MSTSFKLRLPRSVGFWRRSLQRTLLTLPCARNGFLANARFLSPEQTLGTNSRLFSQFYRTCSIFSPARNENFKSTSKGHCFRHLPCRSLSKKLDECYTQRGSSSRTKLYYTLKHYIQSPENADTFVSHLKEEERRLLLSSLESHQQAKEEQDDETGQITRRQLKLVFLHNCLPYIGFGFLDNAIMIMAGEYIDHTIGLTLGISTMAAAALGNLFSDLAGIGLAGYVEMLCYKIGLPVAALTPEQAEQKSAIVTSNFGKAIGIVIGCIIGMFPLLFAKELVASENNEEGGERNS